MLLHGNDLWLEKKYGGTYQRMVTSMLSHFLGKQCKSISMICCLKTIDELH